jgi:predicted RNA binding protein YcfA (HicA-like mRNA interferase family)
MPKFPMDAPKARVLRALQKLGFQLMREREHIAMIRP